MGLGDAQAEDEYPDLDGLNDKQREDVVQKIVDDIETIDAQLAEPTVTDHMDQAYTLVDRKAQLEQLLAQAGLRTPNASERACPIVVWFNGCEA